MNGLEYLDRLRHESGYYDHLAFFDDKALEDIRDIAAKEGVDVAEFPKTVQELRNKIGHAMLVWNQMKPIMQRHPRFDGKDVLVGDIRGLGFDACALHAPNGDRLILVDLDLKMTLVALGQLLMEAAFAIMDEQQGHAPRTIVFDDQSMNVDVPFIISMLLAYTSHFVTDERNPHIEPARELLRRHPYSPPGCRPSAKQEGTFFNGVVTCFVLAHELAHHLLDHVGTGAVQIIKDGTVNWKAIQRSHDQEHQADRLGMELFLLCADDHRGYPAFSAINRQWWMAVPLFFKLMEIARAIRRTSESALSTHPSPIKRLQRVEDELLRRYRNHPGRSAYEVLRDHVLEPTLKIARMPE